MLGMDGLVASRGSPENLAFATSFGEFQHRATSQQQRPQGRAPKMLCLRCPRAALAVFQLIAIAFSTTIPATTIATRDVTSSALINYPYDYSSLACPSSNLSTLITPTYGEEGALFTVCSSIKIDAPASLTRDAVLDFKSYSLWNSFVVSVSLPSNVTETPAHDYVGMPMVFTTSGLVAGLNTTSAEILTVLDYAGVGDDGKSYMLAAWRYDDKLAGVGARAEHPIVVVDSGDGSSWYLSWETYYVGLSTPAIALLKSKLQAQFEAQSADLKTYVEGLL
ncbi:hypothetical protein F4801DRAFT_541754 [Xylaria longipes]|nr:hypothetical protein F4801DRAFT_541754 [Xylaria longipes]RYC65381.1 hypothetical protein CHU98_g829 [Xylaria longipes]